MNLPESSVHSESLQHNFFLQYYVKITVVLLVPILLFSTLIFIFVNKNLKNDITKNNEFLLVQTAQFSRLLFQTFDSVNLMISSDISIINALTRVTRYNGDFSADDLFQVNSLHSALNSFIASNDYIDSVYIHFDEAYYYFSSSDKINRYSDNSLLQSIRLRSAGDSKYNIKPYLFIYNNEILESNSVSVYRNLLNRTGIVVVKINIEKLRQDMYSNAYYGNQQVYISDGFTILRLDTSVNQISSAIASKIFSEQTKQLLKIDEEKYVINLVALERTGWKCAIITSERELYRLQYEITAIIIGAIIGCLCIGGFFALQTASNNCKSIQNILDAINLAEKGELLDIPSKKNDVYHYIVNTIIQNGILQRYMSVQISQRQYLVQLLELKALQYQINPHFFVNTLKTIYLQEANEKGIDSPKSRMVENLLDVTGYILSDASVRVSLAEEIRHTKSFTEILTIRHKDEVTIFWDYTADIERAETCRFILQPLIENAFYHGIRNKKRVKKGKIFIKLYATGEVNKKNVTIKILDNGCGISSEQLQVLKTSLLSTNIPNEHIGMYNLHRRIQLAFGDNYGVRLQSQINIGTCVMVQFPFNRL